MKVTTMELYLGQDVDEYNNEGGSAQAELQFS